ncbi:MAG: DUF6512 family protein [Bacilli bacterium]|nr:DUF6512 family protein [Bacilli bacterium]
MERLNKLRTYEIIGVAVVLMITTVLASIFSNLGDNVSWTQLIETSNISLFEIAQYMFISIIIYSAFEYAVFGDEYRNFIFAKAATAITAPFLFIFLTYFFNSIMLSVDRSLYVATFLIAISLGQLLSYYFLREGFYFKLMNAYGVLSVLLLLMVFYAYVDTRAYLSPIFEPLDSYEQLMTNNTTNIRDTNQRLR